MGTNFLHPESEDFPELSFGARFDLAFLKLTEAEFDAMTQKYLSFPGNKLPINQQIRDCLWRLTDTVD
jgi:hypothetical protein